MTYQTIKPEVSYKNKTHKKCVVLDWLEISGNNIQEITYKRKKLLHRETHKMLRLIMCWVIDTGKNPSKRLRSQVISFLGKTAVYYSHIFSSWR